MRIGRWTRGIRNPLVLLCLSLIRAYQVFLSPMLGKNCRFYPTCSQYAYEALSRFGLVRGTWLALRRILRCGPWHPGGYDPVPLKK
ncbi:membrane protein insertion efficiency factor YidD [Thermanaerovibrio velox]|uniref:membrane protein insertion efficiency factor YidD n=1 Tax=Thermanaerovibrio velox TaxID=108007 RepID=UPI003CCA758D